MKLSPEQLALATHLNMAQMKAKAWGFDQLSEGIRVFLQTLLSKDAK